ncbi:hypothetical protein TanjilG_05800 [Lupinus angustifolius]|uniref:glucan endo-1,3-beta-D-glucosidase n=1 Tax=Lupinus angustifolius TaxID=3871 RepID=A0A4P1R3R7_LUPAN|nr:hypothetical protein TanjilG_05800 [Lupinus angustifolius]
MARTEFLMWILVITLCQLQDAQTQTISSIGVNWGAQASQPMEPSVVVKMLKENGIKKVKLFDADSWTVSAFKGTDIELMVGIPNDQLKKLSKTMQRIQSAIEKAGHGDQIKVTTALNADVYESSSEKPSDGDFRKDIYTVMKQIVQFLDEKNSPFVVNIYPFLSLYQSPDFPKEFAFFDSTNSQIDDDGAHYSNMFDANLDTLVASLKKIGHPNVSIVIGEIGWPTDGDINANIQNAKKFYRGFFKKMATKKGSPRHPKAVTVYLFGLFDENLKSVAPGNFERHWGIFRYDGKAKFQVDFSGKGEDKYPISAKGVRYQENKWCVLKKDVKNITSLGGAMSYACAGGDCTSLGYGCTCNGILDGAGNASYAFNQYFQINEQSVEACDFDGVADIVSKDPSKDACTKRKQNSRVRNSFASVSIRDENPFDFVRTLFEGVIAGGTAGVVVETALYPIDTIKTRLQAGLYDKRQTTINIEGYSFLCSVLAARGGEKLVFKGLYSGLAGNLAGVLPASALFVGVYEPMKQKLLRVFPENLSAFAHLTAGALGGIAASLIRVPTEVVKQRMQTRQFTSASGAVRYIASKEGFKGLYAGYGSFLLRDLPFDAIQFCLYEQIRIGYKLAARRDLNDPENALIGAFAGALTGAITTPLDVIKTRLMIQGSGNQYKGIVDCVQTIIKEEGPSALLKGVGPRVLWIGIGGSIFFGVLESSKRFLSERRPALTQSSKSDKHED